LELRNSTLSAGADGQQSHTPQSKPEFTPPPRTLPRQAALVARPTNEDQVAQVIRNILENAINHGRDGGMITVTLQHAVAENGTARPGALLSIADDGPGIAKHHIPRLTERFYRVDAARSRHKGGTGLGLAISRHIVMRHRGRLGIESTEGVGTKVSVWLPIG
jgi:two-component system phosphate regulon sensor histidine kinase PhoR